MTVNFGFRMCRPGPPAQLSSSVAATRPRLTRLGLLVVVSVAAGCNARETECPRCSTLIIAATGSPDALFPPLVRTAVGRDISDLIYERLANLEAGAAPLDSSSYRPGLASRWERVDSVTLRFTLRAGAGWQDGRAVTARDVKFSFAAYADTALAAAARETVQALSVESPDDSTVLIRFPRPDPEQWYQATWFVRILPQHLWDSIPRSQWAADTSFSRLVGSGPFRLVSWTKGQSLTLERAAEPPSRRAPEPRAIERVVWRFAADPEAALNLLLTHEADLLENVGDSAQAARVRSDSALTTIAYPSAVYGFLGFNLGPRGPATLRSRELRRALAMATDRATAAHAVFGAEAIVPPGPMSRALWINDPAIAVLPYDSAAAGRALDQAGWTRRGPDRMRARGGRPLAVDILVPSTSLTRRSLAQVVQEMWRKAGIRATVTTVDFPVFQERLRSGRFESFIGAWLDEPSPRSLASQWTSAGIGTLNYVHYRNAAFDSLFRRASTFRGPVADAKAAWREALDILSADAPAIWLYTPTLIAGLSRRVEGVMINPYSWLAGLTDWSLRN